MEKSKKHPTNKSNVIATLALLALASILLLLTFGKDIALLNPKGMIADEQNSLLIMSTLVMLGFAVPVILTIYFMAWRYREDNGKSDYHPETKNNKAFLLFAWGGPLITVLVLASLMLPATQRLAPKNAIASDNSEITVQVVSLNWKWLFIYPEHGIAAINHAQIPVDTPVRFELTADGAPMSAFWIPHLGGMLYSMTGHVNPLNLVADTVGDYPGSSAEINGPGFAGMKFITRVSSQEDFDAWVNTTKQSSPPLDEAEYSRLLEPSENNKAMFYSTSNPQLFNTIVEKYNAGHQHDGDSEGNESY